MGEKLRTGPSVSIITVNYNQSGATEELLKSSQNLGDYGKTLIWDMGHYKKLHTENNLCNNK